MSKTVKVIYNAETLMTEITVNGQPFDTSRINGKEIADWAYPFMMRKVKWNGFYDEMVEALGGEKAFDLVFDGSEDALNELKESWEDASVTVISEEGSGNNVIIEYDENTLNTNITVNGQPFDTSRISGKEIEDWVYPFMVRKVKWDGIFEELAKAVGAEEYTIQFSGSNSAMKVLMEECPEDSNISIIEFNNKSCYEVHLISYNDCFMPVIKAVIDNLQITLSEAKQLVESAPILITATCKSKATELKTKLEQAGASIEISETIRVISTHSYEGEIEGIRNLFINCGVNPDDHDENVQYINEHIWAAAYCENIVFNVLIDTNDTKYDSIRDKCLAELKKYAVNNNSAIAYAILGTAYYILYDINEPYEKSCEKIQVSLQYFEKAFELGFVEASRMLMDFYRDVFFDTQNDIHKEKFKLYEKICDAGYGCLCTCVAHFSEDKISERETLSESIEENAYNLSENEMYELSLKYRELSVKCSNYPLSISNLGWHYQYGKGVNIDINKARSYYKQAADMGNEWSQNKLSELDNMPSVNITPSPKKSGITVQKATDTMNKVVKFAESETGQNIIKVGKVIGQIGKAIYNANKSRNSGAGYYDDSSYDCYDDYDDEY